MTPAESLSLARFVKAACPQQKFDEFTPDAWAILLEDLDFADSKTAATVIARRQPFVAPAEIRTEVKRMRAARFGEPGCEQPPAVDPDDVAGYLDALRRQRRAVADGVEPLTAIEAPKTDRAADIAEKVEAAQARQGAIVGVRAARTRSAERAAAARLVSEDRRRAKRAAAAELDPLRPQEEAQQ